ncbi:hypothetical protein K0U83_23215 [bacterium]|nr:hypothetical protein [bacterium]
MRAVSALRVVLALGVQRLGVTLSRVVVLSKGLPRHPLPAPDALGATVNVLGVLASTVNVLGV